MLASDDGAAASSFHHGGRTLDTQWPCRCAAAHRRCAGRQLPCVDGGIRRWHDVMKAWRWAARAVLSAGPGDGAGRRRRPGVALLLRLLRDELENGDGETGCRTLARPVASCWPEARTSPLASAYFWQRRRAFFSSVEPVAPVVRTAVEALFMFARPRQAPSNRYRLIQCHRRPAGVVQATRVLLSSTARNAGDDVRGRALPAGAAVRSFERKHLMGCTQDAHTVGALAAGRRAGSKRPRKRAEAELDAGVGAKKLTRPSRVVPRPSWAVGVDATSFAIALRRRATAAVRRSTTQAATISSRSPGVVWGLLHCA